MQTVTADWPVTAETSAWPAHHQVAAPHAFGRTAGLLEDAAMAILVAYLVPVVILLVGTPLALCVRGILAIVKSFS